MPITKYEFMFCTALWLLISNLLMTFGFDLSFNQVIFGGLIYLGLLSIGYPFARYKYQKTLMDIVFFIVSMILIRNIIG